MDIYIYSIIIYLYIYYYDIYVLKYVLMYIVYVITRNVLARLCVNAAASLAVPYPDVVLL